MTHLFTAPLETDPQSIRQTDGRTWGHDLLFHINTRQTARATHLVCQLDLTATRLVTKVVIETDWTVPMARHWRM